MDKVYVVKSVNVDNETHILPDHKGIGVFLNYEDARKCLDQNIKELMDLYNKVDNPLGVEIFEKEDKDFEGCLFCYCGNSDELTCCDFIGLYHCEIGKWYDAVFRGQ